MMSPPKNKIDSPVDAEILGGNNQAVVKGFHLVTPYSDCPLAVIHSVMPARKLSLHYIIFYVFHWIEQQNNYIPIM